MEVSRRDFFKTSGGLMGLLTLPPLLSRSTGRASESDEKGRKALLIDVTKCVGCWYCYAACRQANGHPESSRPDWEDPPELGPETYTTLHIHDESGRKRFRKHACMHCTDAACVRVCPTGALSHNALGFVQYDAGKCSGCGYCTQYCPFGVPQLGDAAFSNERMDKCTFCRTRVEEGKRTACAEACRVGAIRFGNREELLAEARSRVEELESAGSAATLYGDSPILGGLHALYILDDSPEAYGLPADPSLPPPAVVHDVLQWLGIGAFVAVVSGFSLNYLVARARIAREEKE